VSAATEGLGSRAALGVDPDRPEFGHATFDESHLPPMRAPSDVTGLKAALERRYVLKLLVQREIKARYQRSVLGLLWSYINPLSQFCIYFFIMGTIFALHKAIPNFAIHIFSAIVIVHFFTETMGAGTRSIVRNAGIVKKMAMPREMFPVATMLTSLYHVGPQVVILVVVSSLAGWRPDLYGVAAFALALLIIMILGIGIALLLSAANVFFADVGNAVSIVQNLLRFVVPMIYSYSQVQDRFGPVAPYYVWNPIADAVMLSQRAFWIGTIDDGTDTSALLPDHLLLHGLGAVGISLVVLAAGQLVFSRLENKIPERL
jgi:ABC-2 type transport system permease protein